MLLLLLLLLLPLQLLLLLLLPLQLLLLLLLPLQLLLLLLRLHAGGRGPTAQHHRLGGSSGGSGSGGSGGGDGRVAVGVAAAPRGLQRRRHLPEILDGPRHGLASIAPPSGVGVAIELPAGPPPA